MLLCIAHRWTGSEHSLPPPPCAPKNQAQKISRGNPFLIEGIQTPTQFRLGSAKQPPGDRTRMPCQQLVRVAVLWLFYCSGSHALHVPLRTGKRGSRLPVHAKGHTVSGVSVHAAGVVPYVEVCAPPCMPRPARPTHLRAGEAYLLPTHCCTAARCAGGAFSSCCRRW